MEIKVYYSEFGRDVEYTNTVNGENNILNVSKGNDDEDVYLITLIENGGEGNPVALKQFTQNQLLDWCNFYILNSCKDKVYQVNIVDTEFTMEDNLIVVDCEDMSEFCQTVIEEFNL